MTIDLWGEYKFKAFVSYSSKDRLAGMRFQKELEWYQIPRPLRGRKTSNGSIPKRLSPIFRDRTDLSAGDDLAELIEEGLQQSAWLIVLCSPRSAASKWVNSEIRRFKEWGRGHRIIAVLVDGLPSKFDSKSNPNGAFPPALLQVYDRGGDPIKAFALEPFAPSICEPEADGSGGDGFHLAFLKTVARMLDLSLIELTQRQSEADRAEKRLYMFLASSGLTLAMVALTAAWFATHQRNEALRNESRIFADKASEHTELNWPDRGIYTALYGLPVGEGLLPIKSRPIEPTALARLSEALNRFGHRKRVVVRNEEKDINQARFLSDEKSILIFCDEYVGIFDLELNKLRVLMNNNPEAVVLFPDEKSILVADSNWVVYRITLADGKTEQLFQANGGPIWDLDISPTGDRIVSGLYDQTARIWSASNGQEIHVLPGHDSPVGNAMFSPNGKWILTVAADNTARLWESSTGAEQFMFREEESLFRTGAFSPNGTFLALPTSDGVVHLWNIESGERIYLLQGHTNDISSVQFSPDSNRLVSTSYDGTVRIWDIESGAEVVKLSINEGYIRSAHFSPDGQRVLTATDGGKVRIWEAFDGTEIDVINTVPSSYDNRITTAVYSPKGTFILSFSNYDVQLLDPRAGIETFILRGDSGPATAAAYSPDGRKLVIAYEDFNAITWNSSKGTQEFLLGKEVGSVFEILFSKSGNYFVTGSWDHKARVWNATNGTLIATLDHNEIDLSCIAISSHEQLVATAGAEVIRIWNPETGKLIRELKGHKANVESISFAPDSELIASASEDGTVRVWKIETGSEIKTLHDPGGWFRVISFSPSGEHIVTGGNDGVIRMWDSASGKELFTMHGHRGQVHSIAYSPDGRLILTTSYDETARLWEAKDGSPIAELRGKAGEIVEASFSSDSTRVVTGAQFGNGVAHVWDAFTGLHITSLRGHRGPVNDISFSPDGRFIVTASTDGTARVWTAPRGIDRPRELLSLACESIHEYRRAFSQEELADLGLPPLPNGNSPCDQFGLLSPRWWSQLWSRIVASAGGQK